MKRVAPLVFLIASVTSSESFGACSPSVSESKAGGNIVITNNCGLSDEEVLKRLDAFKDEQLKSSKNQIKNQRELIRKFNKNQVETSAKLDQILEDVQALRNRGSLTDIANEETVTAPNPIPKDETDIRKSEASETAMENNFITILESIKTHPLMLNEDMLAKVLINQNIRLTCTKFSQIANEAKKLNGFTNISLTFTKRIAPLFAKPLEPNCFQILSKELGVQSADAALTIIKIETSKTRTDPASSKTQTSSIEKSDASTSTSTRSIVRTLVTALGNEQGGYRLEAIRANLNNLPSDLSADEVILILGNESGGYKEATIKEILPKILKESLSGSKVSRILGTEEGGYRNNQITLLTPYIRPYIGANDAISIVSGLYSSNRGQIIGMLADRIQQPLGSEEIESLLGDTSGEYRRIAIKALLEAQLSAPKRQDAQVQRQKGRSETPRQSARKSAR